MPGSLDVWGTLACEEHRARPHAVIGGILDLHMLLTACRIGFLPHIREQVALRDTGSMQLQQHHPGLVVAIAILVGPKKGIGPQPRGGRALKNKIDPQSRSVF